MDWNSAKQLLIVAGAAVLAVYLLERIKPPPHSHQTRSSSTCAQIGTNNRSGIRPYDPFGLCHGEQAKYAGGR